MLARGSAELEMFEEFLHRREEKKAQRVWEKSHLGQMLDLHTQKYFTKYPSLANKSAEAKIKIGGDFYQKVINLMQGENPFLLMRELLAEYVLQHTHLQVLCLTEQEKADEFDADCAYISGQLHYVVDQAVLHVEELRELKWRHPEFGKSDYLSYCNQSCLILSYYINGINIVRGEFDDFDSQKDWLRPFFKSMLITAEDGLRGKMGLPSLLTGNFDALKHSTFLNYVIAGHRNPYFEWEKSWHDA